MINLKRYGIVLLFIISFSSYLSADAILEKRQYDNNLIDEKIQKIDNNVTIQEKLARLERENRQFDLAIKLLIDKNRSLLIQLQKKDKKSSQYDNVRVLNIELNATKELLKATNNKLKELQKNYSCIDNTFPKLMMKVKKDEKKITPMNIDDKIIENSPKIDVQPRLKKKKVATYRLNQESILYNKPNGKPIEIWEERRSFTGSETECQWVKVTGYFINRKWKKADEELWVKKENVIKR